MASIEIFLGRYLLYSEFHFFFGVGVGNASFETIVCSKHPIHTAKYTGEVCLQNYRQAEIGFALADGRFIREIEICFDDVEQHTRYSKFTLSHFIGGHQLNYPRPAFTEGTGFYNRNGKLETVYTRNTHRLVINTLVGLPSDSNKYINDTDDYYLARGHLTAKTDFVYGAQHRLTFYFINVAPQWQTFNAGNWQSLEDSLQKFAATRPNNLEVKQVVMVKRLCRMKLLEIWLSSFCIETRMVRLLYQCRLFTGRLSTIQLVNKD